MGREAVQKVLERASWGESGAAGAFCCIFVKQLSKTIFPASHCTTEIEEAAL